MAVAGVMTLAVPVIGWHSVKQLNDALVQSRIDAQRLSVAHLQLVVSGASRDGELAAALDRGRTVRHADELYVETAEQAFTVDGYLDDWRLLQSPPTYFAGTDSQSLRVRAAQHQERLHVLIEVQDDHVVWHRPPRWRADAGEGELPDWQQLLANGDAVELLLSDEGAPVSHAVLRAIAPGPLSAFSMQDSTEPHVATALRRVPEIRAAWQVNGQGYVIELALTKELSLALSRLGIASVDVDDSVRRSAAAGAGSLSIDKLRATLAGADTSCQLPLVYRQSRAAREHLLAHVSPGHRARLFDQSGRLLADIDRLNERREDASGTALFDSLWDAVLFRVFSWLVAGDLPLPDIEPLPTDASLHLNLADPMTDGATRRYVTPSRDRVLGTLVSVASVSPEPTSAWLWFESNEEHSQAYTGSRLARLFSLLILASLFATSVLFAWGTWLSLRIRRLSRAATMAIGDDGRRTDRPLRASRAPDELGVLSRDLASLLERSADYNHYLETLSRYLSHELRTPLSVVRTSLENLQTDELGEESRALLSRAAGGADELTRILAAIVDSTRLEQTMEFAERHPIELGAFVDGCVERYRQLYPAYQIDRGDSLQEVWATASPELLLQALDKMLDNAVSYASKPDIVITLSKRRDDKRPLFVFSVRNQMMPERAAVQTEAHTHDHRHLGLGLHVVRMIAKGHGGRLYQHRTDGSYIAAFSIVAE